MNKKKGFTLIELLVVIAIISLLLSILMPALGKIKEQAKVMVCRTNMHQFGVANISYAADNNDWFPIMALPEGNPPVVWQSDVPWALGDGHEKTRCRDMWAPYLDYDPDHGGDVFYCPSSPIKRTDPYKWEPDAIWASMGYTYFGNYKAGEGNSKPPNSTAFGLWKSYYNIPTKLSKTNPQTTLMGDITQSYLSGSSYQYTYNHGKGKRDGAHTMIMNLTNIPPDGANQSKADGSAVWVDFYDMELAIQSPIGPAWWWGIPVPGGDRYIPYAPPIPGFYE